MRHGIGAAPGPSGGEKLPFWSIRFERQHDDEHLSEAPLSLTASWLGAVSEEGIRALLRAVPVISPEYWSSSSGTNLDERIIPLTQLTQMNCLPRRRRRRCKSNASRRWLVGDDRYPMPGRDWSGNLMLQASHLLYSWWWMIFPGMRSVAPRRRCCTTGKIISCHASCVPWSYVHYGPHRNFTIFVNDVQILMVFFRQKERPVPHAAKQSM